MTPAVIISRGLDGQAAIILKRLSEEAVERGRFDGSVAERILREELSRFMVYTVEAMAILQCSMSKELRLVLHVEEKPKQDN
jgi:hypothetical protein